MPTCASVDATSTLPQMILTGGGSLAMLVGIIGAVASDQYKQDFAITAAAGLAASLIGGIWAVASFNSNFMQQPQCTGPGIAALGAASVSPQSTPAGVQPPAPSLSLPYAAPPVAVPAGA